MVLGQVGEDEHGETSSLEPSLRRRHRGRLHHAGAIPLHEHLAEEALQVDRLRGVETDLAHVRADPTFDVGEEPGLLTRGGEDRPEQVGGRRLAVRARDRGNGQQCRGIVEELHRGPRHRCAHAGHDQLRRIDLEPALDHERDRPLLERLDRKIVAVRLRARDAKEEGAALHLPRVVRQLADLEGTVSNDVGRSERCDEPLQLHFAAQV